LHTPQGEDRVGGALDVGPVESPLKTVGATACVSWPVEQVYPKVIENREVGPRGHAAFTPLFNLALVPGISIRCGSGRDGLPVGLQIVAPRLHDRPLLAMAQRAEAALA
jgi:aspartyl-tRNA(Asn)/glutamyl-tRNA(Gln) amidotransferase subunit A